MANMMNNSNSNKTNAKPTFKTGSPWDKTMEEQDEEKKLKEKKEKQAYQDRLDAYRKSIYDKLDDESKAFIDKEEADEKRKAENEKAKEADALLRKYNLGSFGQAYEDYVKDLLSVQKRAQNGEYIDKDTLTVLEQKGNGVLRMAGAYEKYLDLAGDKTGFKPVDDAKGSNLKALKDGIVGSIDLTKQYSKTFGKYETPEAYMADFDDMVYGEKYDGSSYADIQDAIGKTEGREKAWLEKNGMYYMGSKEAQAEMDALGKELEKADAIKKQIKDREDALRYGWTRAHLGETEIKKRLAEDATLNRLKQELKAYEGMDERVKELEEIRKSARLNELNQYALDESFYDYSTPEPYRGAPVDLATGVDGVYAALRGAPASGNASIIAREMDISERELFYYIYTQKGRDEAQEYLDLIGGEILSRPGKRLSQKVKDLPFIAEIPAAAGLALASGFDRGTTGTMNALASLGGKTMDTSLIQYASQEYEKELGRVGKWFYGAGNSVGNMLPSILLGNVAGALGASAKAASTVSAASIGVSSYGSAYKQALDEGYGVGQAITYGLLTGASEAALQRVLGGVGSHTGIGEEALLKRVATVGSKLSRVALTGAVKLSSEVLEEELQAVLEPFFKSVVMNEDYDAPTLDELFDTLITTLISTGVLEGKSIVQGASLPESTVDSFKQKYDHDGKPDTFLANLFADDSLISAKVIQMVRDGDTNGATKALNNGIRNYEYAKTYMDAAWGSHSSELDAKIDMLKTLKNAVSKGTFNAQAAQTALTKTSPVWEAAADHNDAVIQTLLDKGASNSKIEKTILGNHATKAAFQRITGIDLDSFGTISEKRSAVKTMIQGFSDFRNTEEYQRYMELAKENETENSASKRQANQHRMIELMRDVQKRLGNSSTDKGKAINALSNVAMRNAQKNSVFAFASHQNDAEDTKTGSGKAGSVTSFYEALADEHLAGLDADLRAELVGATSIAALNDKASDVLDKLNARLITADPHDKTAVKEAKTRNAAIQKQIDGVKAYVEDVRTGLVDLSDMRAADAKNLVENRIRRAKKLMKKYGVKQVEGFDGGITYYGRDSEGNKVEITEEEARSKRLSGETYTFKREKGSINTSTGVMRLARDLANGYVNVMNFATGEMDRVRVGKGPGMISPEAAVDMVVMHEAVHWAKAHGDPGLVKAIVGHIADTRYDKIFELGNRLQGREVGDKAQKAWDKLRETYVAYEMEQGNLTRERAEEKVTDDYLYEEIAADYMGNLMTEVDIAVALYQAKPNLFERIRLAVQRFADRRKADKDQPKLYAAAQDLADRLKAISGKTYGRGNKTAAKTETNGDTADGNAPKIVTSEDGSTEYQETPALEKSQSEQELVYDEETVIEDKNGNPSVAIEENGSARASLSTYEESGRDILSEYLNERVSDTGLSEQDAADILSSLDEIYDICNGMKDEYETFGAWSEAKVETDENGNPVFSVIKANGEYAMNLDFSLVCKKRRALDAVFNRLVEMGKITDFDLGQEQIVKINDIIRDHGFEVACALCFVDAKRFKQAKVADDFVTMYNGLVRSLDKNKVGIDSFNFGGDQTVSPVEDGIHTLPDSELDFTKIDAVLNGGKSGTVIYKIAQHLKDNPQDRRLVSRGDFMSADGFGEVKKRNPKILSLYNSKKGMNGPKASFGDVQYLNDILSSKKFDVEKAYDVGGVRIQSFSDYVARLVFDYTQMVADLAAKGLPAHAYTKEVLFVKQFGLTGIKINMSLIPAIGDGRYAGLNADGSYAWAKESFPLDEAYSIQADAEYGKNCGTIAVGVSDVHIWKMLDDPAIRMVIPYHKSGINPIVAHMMNIDGFKNYTTEQNTRYRNGKKLNKADMSQVPDFNVLMHREGLNAVEASRRYVEWCEERGYLPKFHRFAYKTVNGERVFNENYYKLLEDFTTMVDGVYHPQEAVKMVFPNKDSAFGSMAELIRSGLEEDAVTAARLDADVDNIVNEIGEVLSQPVEVAPKKSKGKKGEVRYSVSDTLDSDLDSILDGSFEASRNELYLGETSNFMTDVIGADSLSLYMPASKAYSSLVTREEYEKKPYYSKQNHYHGIGKKDFIEILEKSEAPIAAFADTADSNGNERNNRIVLVTDKIIKNAESKKDGYAVVIEEVDSVGRSGGKSFRANKAITFYSIDQIEHDLSLALDDGRLLDINKKGEHLLNMRRGGNSQATIQKGVLKNNIAHFWANVKWKNAKNKKMSTGPDNLPTEMQRALEKAGYQQQYTQNGQKGSNRGSVSEEIDEDTIQEDMQKAYDHFGTTTSFDQTGFVDGEGRMLKLSQYGLSGVNHSRIGEIYDDVKGSDAVNRFIQEGNVRIKATSPGIEIGEKAINTRQMNAISRFISGSLAKRGYFYLDITGRDGNTIASVEYDDDASAEDVLYDIKAYYERGRVPKNQTRYSVSEEMDANYFDALDRGDEATLERIVEETARAAGYNTPRLFHGTQKFGFTDIDVSKSDDQVTVFATANEEVARTYTHHGNDPVKGDRRLVSDQPIMSYEEFDALPEKELLPYVKEYLGQDFKVVPLSEATKAAREFLKTTRQRLIELTEEKAKGLTKRNLRNRLRDAITALSEVIASKNTYTYSDAQNEYYNKLANLTREKGDVVREATKIMSQAEWAINMIPVTYEDYTYENPYEDITLLSNGKIVYDVEQARNEVKKLLFKGIYSFYGKLTNPLVVDGKGAAWSQIDGAYIGEKGKKVSTRDVALYAKEHGYDGVIYKKIIDNNVREEGLGASDVYAFFVESALKSADPVTYDNDGNVIPPSERFNSETNDIRRSVSEEMVEDDSLSYQAMEKELAQLRKRYDNLRHELVLSHGTKLDANSVKKELGDILFQYRSHAKMQDIEPMFHDIFRYTYNNVEVIRDSDGRFVETKTVKEIDASKLDAMVKELATTIFDAAVDVSDTYKAYGHLVKEILDTKIQITEEIKDSFDGEWNTFRQKNFGRMGLVNATDGASNLDAVYRKLADQYPELFDEEVKNPAEQLHRMADVSKTLREEGLNPQNIYGIEGEAIIEEISNDIIDAFYQADRKLTFADKSNQKVADAAEEGKRAVKAEEKRGDFRVAETRLADQMHYGKKLAELRRRYEDRVRSVTEKFETKMANRSEGERVRHQKQMADKRGKDLVRRLAKPTKTKHVPIDYEADVYDLLSKITWAEGTKVDRDTDTTVTAYLEAVKKRGLPKQEDGIGFSEALKNDIKNFEFKPMDAMDSAELTFLNQLLQRAVFEINNADKVFRTGGNLKQAVQKSIDEYMLSQHQWKVKGRMKQFAESLLGIADNALDPETFFRTLEVSELTDAFEDIAAQQDVYTKTVRMFANEMSKIVGEDGVPRKWREDTVSYTTQSGKTINASASQLMTLYLLSKQNDSRRCLVNDKGGAIFASTVKRNKITGGRSTETYGSDAVTLTEDDIDQMRSLMEEKFPEARTVADQISELLNTTVSDLANQTSIEVEGYRKFGIENYFPMMVFGGKEGSIDDALNKLFTSIVTGSFEHERTGNANKVLLVADIFSVVNKHLLGVANYHAYKKAVVDMNRLVHTRGMDGRMSLAMRIGEGFGAKAGNQVVKYIDDFLQKVQNGQMDAHESPAITEKLFQNYKANAVTMKLSVVAKQPASLLRALPELSGEGLKVVMKRGLTPVSKKVIDEMVEHSGLAQMKAWGFSENATGKSFDQLYDKNSISWRERMNESSAVLAEQADMNTWGIIWMACKAETKTIEEATKKFNEVIRRTQVVDTVTTSSKVSREKGWKQFLFAFKNEPLKTFNYLRSAVHDAIIGKQGAGKHLGKVISSTLLNTLYVASISSLFTLGRDEEEDTKEKWLEGLLKNATSDLLGTLFIFGGDLYSVIETAWGPYGNKSPERLDVAGLYEFVQNVYGVYDYFGKSEEEQKKTGHRLAYDVIRATSAITGLPVGNLMGIGKSIDFTVANLTDDPMLRYKIVSRWYNVDGINNTTVTAKFRDILTDALDDGNYKGFDKVQKELRSKGFGTNEISKAVAASDTLYEAWCEGPAVLRAELAKAKGYTEILRYEDVVSSLGSRKTSLVTDLYDAVRLGDKEAEEAAREALLNHRDAKTLSKLREYEVKDLLESKYNSSINDMIKDKFTGVEREGAAYKKAMSLVLAEFKHFGVTEQEVKRRIANLSIRFS